MIQILHLTTAHALEPAPVRGGLLLGACHRCGTHGFGLQCRGAALLKHGRHDGHSLHLCSCLLHETLALLQRGRSRVRRRNLCPSVAHPIGEETFVRAQDASPVQAALGAWQALDLREEGGPQEVLSVLEALVHLLLGHLRVVALLGWEAASQHPSCPIDRLPPAWHAVGARCQSRAELDVREEIVVPALCRKEEAPSDRAMLEAGSLCLV